MRNHKRKRWLCEATARRAQQSNVKLCTSSPLTLYAVKFSAPAKSANDKKLREALSLSSDRNAMARVLLQKQAEAASSFLPQWLSGYSFLFDMETNLELAKELRARLTLQIASRDATRVSSDVTGAKAESEAGLVSWRYTSLSPREVLEGFELNARWEIPAGGVPADADARYAWEKHMMEQKNLLPLVLVPDFAALDSRVRNWPPSAWGEWHLADVWLDQGDPGANLRDAGAKTPAGAKP